MKIGFEYIQGVKIHFGVGKIYELDTIAKQNGFCTGILICDKIFIQNGLTQELKEKTTSIRAIFSEVSPNPLLAEVMKAVEMIKEYNADFVVAMGGGSSMDLAKFACSMVYAEGDIRDYFYKRKVFGNEKVALIAVPTTAGTGSEVTCVSVCNDELNNTKAPLNHKNFYADIALVDPELTLSVPKKVTADTGLDALSHALEGFWSVNHQPICDMFAVESCRLIFDNLEKAYNNGQDIEAREKMSLAALYAGLSFGLPKTAGCHACSYPLSINYNLSHGQACALTLDSFIKINQNAENGRLNKFSQKLGFDNAEQMAMEVLRLKKVMNMKCSLSDCGITDTDTLAYECSIHPLMSNNPVKADKKLLKEMFENLR